MFINKIPSMAMPLNESSSTIRSSWATGAAKACCASGVVCMLVLVLNY
jgi:hypothetical protein